MSLIVQCNSCGGAVVFNARDEVAACLFCGSVSLDIEESTQERQPDGALVIEFEREAADTEYRNWAKSSWWNPKALRSLSVELRVLYVPAWRFKGEVESRWAGLVSAVSPSGKRPVSGSDIAELERMVPASQGLTLTELDNLHPWHEDKSAQWNTEENTIPFEVPALSEVGARERIHDLMGGTHQRHISQQHSLLSINSTSRVTDADVKLYMLPIWIGAFRYRDKPWRFVVNAQTGEVVGNAPVDRVKVALVLLGVVVGLVVLFNL